jgi:hypothetical protein
VLKVQGGEIGNEGRGVMASKGERALTGLVILGFVGFLLYGLNGAIIGAIVGAAIGYLWR